MNGEVYYNEMGIGALRMQLGRKGFWQLKFIGFIGRADISVCSLG